MSELVKQESRPDEARTESLLKRLSANRFTEWRQERKYRQNIKNGQSYFNGPDTVPPPERHSPSQLLQCHRKLFYRQENAPEERPDPDGIFWFGSRFEDDLVFPFLEEVITDEETYVQNSIWVDYTVETSAGKIRIRGSTDPVVVDADAVPVLPTEIKTKDSVGDIPEPNTHHRAQLHAYLIGLSKKFGVELSTGVIVYGGRESLDVQTFEVAFDERFWSDVILDWAEQHTAYRLGDELPPADPEQDWECRFCDYRHRCGESNLRYDNHGPEGLLPDFAGYPRQKVINYLESHPSGELTPAVARQYPDIAEQYPVRNWYCAHCGSEIAWDAADPDGEPLCPKCANQGTLSSLSMSPPEEPY